MTWLGTAFLIFCIIVIGVCAWLDEDESRKRAEKMRFQSLRYTDED